MIRKALAAIAGLALSIGAAFAQPGPGPVPSPWTVSGAQVSLPGQQCVVMPTTVTGGCKGNNTINAAGIFVNGNAVLTSASGVNLIVGTSGVTSGTPGRVLFDNTGVLGEYAITGTGSVVMSNSPALVTPSASSLAITGAAGAGFAELAHQSASPAAGSAMRLYAGATGALSWIRSSDGFTRTLDNTLTASRVWTMPDASATIAALSVAQTWSAAQSFNSGNLKLNGATSGALTVNCAATCGSNTITLPNGTTDFSATGGASQVLKQSAAGAAITVGQLGFTDLTGVIASAQVSGSYTNITAVGTIATGVWNGTAVDLAHGGTNASLTASAGGIVYSTGSAMAILPGTVTASQCLLSGSNAPPTWGSCSGAAAVSAVSNSDGTLTISPTTGAVVASIALGHANTWTAAQNQDLSTNAGFAPTISNTNAGTSAFAAINVGNGTNNFEFGMTGVNYTAIPILGNRAFGLVVGTDIVLDTFTATKAIIFGVANAEVGRWSGATAGELDLGVSATTAGALKLFGSASGSTTLAATAAAGSTTATFQAATGTVALLDVADQTVSGGANVTSRSLSTGNVTIDCGSRPLQFITNGGLFTITNPAADGSCMLLVTNNASAGAITFSGFTVGSNTGDAFTTTNNNKFLISIARVNGVSTYINKALQ